MTTTTTRTRTTKKTTTRTARRQRGVALILVLWTFAAIAVLAAEFARAMHDEAASTSNFKESTRARFVAIAAVNEVILALKENRGQVDLSETDEDEEGQDPVRSLSQADGQWVKAGFRGHAYEVRVVDEAGKVGLNKVDYPMLMTILQNLEVPDRDAETIADSILDWRDADDFHQPNGAESDYYESLPRPYRAKNAAFDSVEELLLVRGVTREIFYGSEGIPGLREIFSVYSSNRINPKSATPAVIQALAGLDPEAAGNFATARRHGGVGGAAVDELRTAMSAAGVSILADRYVPSDMTVEARVYDASGRAILAHVGMVLNLSNDGDELRVYRWYDSIFHESDQPGGEPADGTAS